MLRLNLCYRLIRTAFITLVLVATGVVGAVDNADIYGRWRITKILGAADISAISDKDARKLLGKTARIQQNAFIFNGETCDHPSYERTTQDLVRSFREEGHASPANMGLPDPVTSIDARCTHLFLKRPGIIVIHWDGYYFDAVKY
jgi:hypothetical protein